MDILLVSGSKLNQLFFNTDLEFEMLTITYRVAPNISWTHFLKLSCQNDMGWPTKHQIWKAGFRRHDQSKAGRMK